MTEIDGHTCPNLFQVQVDVSADAPVRRTLISPSLGQSQWDFLGFLKIVQNSVWVAIFLVSDSPPLQRFHTVYEHHTVYDTLIFYFLKTLDADGRLGN